MSSLTTPRRSFWLLKAVLLLAAACAINPATGERTLSLVSESQEIEMGRQGDAEAAVFFGLYEDEGLQAYVSDLGHRLAAQSERPNLPWTFRLADDPVVNAFALPGGFIYITRGIMASLNSEAELAGVMGHEIGHVTARHSAQQMSRQQLQQIGLAAGMILSEHVYQYGELLAAGLQVLNLSYSRGDESESDQLGIRYMTRSGYDPHALIGVFQTLALESGSPSDRVPEWTMTHPYPENREARIQELISRTGQDYAGFTSEREGYLRRIDGMVFGPNPREGFFDEGRFHHPDLGFRIDFPSGWESRNQKTQVFAVSPQEDAVFILSVAQGVSSPRAAATAFAQQEGVEVGQGWQGEINGLPAARVPFAARTESGEIRGEVTFVAHGDLVYQLMGYGVAQSWSGNSRAVRLAQESFAPETDGSVLGVQPARLEIVRVPRAMSFEDFLQQFPSSVSPEEVGRINRLGPGQRIEAGSLLKRVVGGELP